MKRPYNEGFASTVNRLRTKLQKKKIDTPSELVIHFCDTNGNPVVVSDEVSNLFISFTV
jgi:hypothetical protein